MLQPKRRRPQLISMVKIHTANSIERNKMSSDKFPLDVISAAQASHARFFPRGPFVSITLAQWAVESCYGTRPSGKLNYFGVKATPAQISTGHATERWTKEYVHGHYVSELLYFADYDTLEEGFDAHATLLTHPWYADCIQAQTPQDYARALQADHYATAPNYAETLISIIKQFDLTQYDKGAPA